MDGSCYWVDGWGNCWTYQNVVDWWAYYGIDYETGQYGYPDAQQQQQQVQQVAPQAVSNVSNTFDKPQVTKKVESVEVRVNPVTNVANKVQSMTTVELVIWASCFVGILLLVACFIRFTPFSKGVSDLFQTLANIARGNKKDK